MLVLWKSLLLYIPIEIEDFDNSYLNSFINDLPDCFSPMRYHHKTEIRPITYNTYVVMMNEISASVIKRKGKSIWVKDIKPKV